ncbi:Protein rds1 [Grifola frondosa]|uniref:Protein rds1 n=1 Tax=Grifola frondosa TaxID=5627 RepID=A0A1C7MJF6_GRIFR|nr:Protein rds1 [Grifola frondosa]
MYASYARILVVLPPLSSLTVMHYMVAVVDHLFASAIQPGQPVSASLAAGCTEASRHPLWPCASWSNCEHSSLHCPFCPHPAPITDTSILQFALTLEHLENNFYSGGLAKFDDKAFADAGFPAWVRGRFVQIAEHEAEHVEFLMAALGDAAPKPCEYSFPYTDPKSFAALSMALETVGASAYLGAARYIQDKDTLTAAGSILAVESRQAGWVSSSVLKLQPWDGAYETPLTPSGAYSLAAAFIKECPSSNPPLPVQMFPSLTVSDSSPKPGSTITVSFDNPEHVYPAYLAWLDGLAVTYTPIDENGKTTVPEKLEGTVFAGAVSSNNMAPSDSTMLSGLAMFQFPFGSYAMTE